MKMFKKVLAGFLAFVMIASGIYFVQSEDGSETVKAAEATEVSADMLTVKAQIANDGSNVIRFITSVDCLDYVRVGFEVTPEGGNKMTYETKTVYERIVSAPDATGVKYEFGPKAVDASSEYFVTAKLRATAGVDYTVKAFVRTQTGEIVYGKSRCVALSDGAANATTVNLSFENTAEAGVKVGDTLNVSYASQTTTATVIGVDGTTVHVRVNVNPNTLSSATKFTFSGTAAGSVIYRNLYTTHVPTSGTAANADTTWYDVYLAEDSTETEFVIATTADLYGFASLVTAGTLFEGKTAYLCADLTVNTNTPANPNLAASWTGYTPQYSWTPIGTNTNQFKGTFDGEGHSITGLYLNRANGTTLATNGYAAMFACTAASCKIMDFKLLNSCFMGWKLIGGISGGGGGTFEGIYTDAYVLSTGTSAERVGGIIGNATQVTTIKESEVAGTIVADVQQAGGFIGAVDGNISTLQDVRFTGYVHVARKTGSGFGNTGGLCGFVTGASASKTSRLVANNCLILGTITYESSVTGGVGEHVGQVAKATDGTKATYDVNYVYAKEGCCAAEKYVGAMNGSYYPNSNANKAGRPTETQLTGVNAYTSVLLNYVINEEDKNEDNAWIIVDGGVPQLKRFATAEAVDVTAQLREDTKWYTMAEADAAGNAPGTTANPYIIKDADDLYGLASLVNAATDNFAGDYVQVACDITMNTNTPEDANKLDSWANYTPQKEWTVIGTSYSDGSGKDWFSGTFDGQGHTIRGLYVAETNNARWTGLFGVTPTTCVVKNVHLEDSYFEANSQVAGIISRGGGTVENVHSNAVVVASAFTGEATGEVFNGTNAGGLVGQIHQSSIVVKNSSFSGTVKTAGSISAGIVGLASGIVSIEGCRFDGEVICGSGYGAGIIGQLTSTTNETTVKDCISTGKVSIAGEFAGGIVGYISDADVKVEACAFTGEVVANIRRAGGIVGYAQKSTLNLSTCMSTGKVQTVQRVGGMIGEAKGTTDVEMNVTMTDCLSAGTTISTNAKNHQQHGGFIGYLITNATAIATRCVMLGKLTYPSDTTGAHRAIIGKVEGDAKYSGAGGVYLIQDAEYYPVNLGFIATQALKDGGGWIGTGGAGHTRVTVEQLTGANAITNLPKLGITTDGTSTWVATQNGFPTLRIFANEADIIK